MALTSTDYLQQLQQLLPQGLAWPRDDSAILTQLLAGLSAELARVDARSEQLVNEADPRVTAELLSDWERVSGLPDPCVGDDQSIEQRRQSLVSRLTTIGGQSRAYFIALAASLGSTITITEFRPHDVNDDVNEPLYGEEWAYAWQVNGAANPVTNLTVNGVVTDPLAWWGTVAVECAFNRLKPAHTTVIFNYA